VLTPEVWTLVWSIAALIDVGLPLKFYNHYYFTLYPPICIAAAVALSLAARNRIKHFALGFAILFASAVPLWAIGESRAARGAEADAPREVAEVVRRAGNGSSSLFVYNYDPVIYALTRLRPPTPYVLGSESVEFSYSSHANGVAEVQRIIDSSPDFIGVHTTLPSEFLQVELDQLVARKLLDYHLIRQIENGTNGVIVSLYQH